MFAEILDHEAWQTIMPGVSVCRLTEDACPGELPLHMEHGQAEVLFCTSGSLTIQKTGGSQVQIEAKEILFVTDCSGMESVRVTEPLEGLLLKGDAILAGDSFRDYALMLGNPGVSVRKIEESMRSSGGFRAISVSPWTRGTFYALGRIPLEDQGRFCALKTFELMYLICIQQKEGPVCSQDTCGGLMSVASAMKTYMEEHMDEKLTITDLSHRFHVSRTACKSTFRSCYGQPIHAWLLDRRMEKAAELLEKTKMPILQVAQSVGYTGVSQFNVAFRQRYGKSPRDYRKMSVSVTF